MNQLETNAVVISIVAALKSRGSWCGETHIQKATYFISRLSTDQLPFTFILYKHGPFSFDLRDELTAMRANSFVTLHAESFQYGARFDVTVTGQTVAQFAAETVQNFRKAIDFVAANLAQYGVATLERLATALYFTSDIGNNEDRVAKIHSAKPHISNELAAVAVADVDRLLEQWRNVGVKSLAAAV